MELCKHNLEDLWSGDEPGEYILVGSCSLCNVYRDSVCGWCNGLVLAPSNWRRKDKVCSCLPQGVKDGVLARYVAPTEQFERKPVATELKDRDFASYPTNTGQTDLSDDMPDGADPSGNDRFGWLVGSEPVVYVRVAQEGTNSIFVRDGLDLADTVSQHLWDTALNEGLEMDGFGHVEEPLEVDHPVEWMDANVARGCEWFNRFEARNRRPIDVPGMYQWISERRFVSTKHMTLR